MSTAPTLPSASFHHLLFLLAAHTTLATDHIVGGHLGWNPGINYSSWINNHTFYVNDLISFRYQKNVYNVFEVNETGYDNCTTEGAYGNWTKGKDFIPLPEAKRYYFFCNGFCQSGMKITILVHPLNSTSNATAAASAQNANANATHSSSPAPFARGGGGSVLAVAVALAVLAVAGWIGI